MAKESNKHIATEDDDLNHITLILQKLNFVFKIYIIIKI